MSRCATVYICITFGNVVAIISLPWCNDIARKRNGELNYVWIFVPAQNFR